MAFAAWKPTNMPRPPRADEAGGLCHVLNRGNLRATIFHKEKDFEAFERIVYEALQIHKVELFSFQLMPNHYHLVLRPLVDGEMSRAWAGSSESTKRPRDRKRVRFPKSSDKEA